MSCASIETDRSMQFKPEKYTQPLELRKRYPSKSTSKMSELIPFTTVTTPLREFRGHEDHIRAVAVFPDERRMVTGSEDKTLRLWDLKTGVMLKKMMGHSCRVWRLAVSQDGKPTNPSPLRCDLLADFFSRWNNAGHWFKGRNGETVEYQNLGATGRSDQLWRLGLLRSVFAVWRTSRHRNRQQYRNI